MPQATGPLTIQAIAPIAGISVMLTAAGMATLPMPVASAEPCTPTANYDSWSNGQAVYQDVDMNACAARKASDEFSNSGGTAGVIGFITGLIPGQYARAAAALLAVKSISDYFVTRGMDKCSSNFTRDVRMSFIDGNFVDCSPK